MIGIKPDLVGNVEVFLITVIDKPQKINCLVTVQSFLGNKYDGILHSKRTLRVSDKVLDLSVPAVMGIINITPDSFYSGSRHQSVKSAEEQAEQMLSFGADILDIGGYSSRPGADEVSESEEIDRVQPVIEHLSKAFPEAIFSVDTFRSGVAEAAMRAGAHMINDISGGQLDEAMYDTVARWQCPYFLMHMKGTPQTMMNQTGYDDLLKEMISYFAERIVLLREKGVHDIIIDPGFGFSKNLRQSYYILRRLSALKVLGLPILSGISRKSMIYKKLGINSHEALNGTTVLNTISLIEGASILRVHDVKEAVEAVALYKETYCD